MSILLLFVGLGLGSVGGFLTALLVLHGRAQSLAEEMVAGQRIARAVGHRAASPIHGAWTGMATGD